MLFFTAKFFNRFALQKLFMKIYTCIIYVLLLISANESAKAQQKITDTVYFNNNWQICEQPIANYYRTGTLVIKDNVCYYWGHIKDFTIDNRLLMDGEYDYNNSHKMEKLLKR